jgi:hypothetical protein
MRSRLTAFGPLLPRSRDGTRSTRRTRSRRTASGPRRPSVRSPNLPSSQGRFWSSPEDQAGRQRGGIPAPLALLGSEHLGELAHPLALLGSEHLGELTQEPDAGLSALTLQTVERRRETRRGLELATGTL